MQGDEVCEPLVQPDFTHMDVFVRGEQFEELCLLSFRPPVGKQTPEFHQARLLSAMLRHYAARFCRADNGVGAGEVAVEIEPHAVRVAHSG